MNSGREPRSTQLGSFWISLPKDSPEKGAARPRLWCHAFETMDRPRRRSRWLHFLEMNKLHLACLRVCFLLRLDPGKGKLGVPLEELVAFFSDVIILPGATLMGLD